MFISSDHLAARQLSSTVMLSIRWQSTTHSWKPDSILAISMLSHQIELRY